MQSIIHDYSILYERCFSIQLLFCPVGRDEGHIVSFTAYVKSWAYDYIICRFRHSVLYEAIVWLIIASIIKGTAPEQI